ncbi:glycosyl hydrolase [Mesorhizobium sp. L-8-10]|uniref:beta-glucosidase H n=1 Tax=Mesorhizobium sp. L-8-10 TaxID=2744523 RepID=UPI0019379C4F|nr:glycosyl hydrolase [Mesorhizobium sp. L-8-10]
MKTEGRPHGRDDMQKKPTEAEKFVNQLTLEEQVSLLSGEDFWSLPAIPRLGVGKLRVTDGPNGARGGGSLVGGVKSAAFPVGIALGATWDAALVEEVGASLAEEVKSKGAHVLLAPTVNIHRSVTNGRNFECYSEDPELSAALAVAYIRGLQGKGVAATIKHFAGNESEIERTTMDSVVDERSLREVYLRPFEAAVKEGGTWAVMSSYNRLNGTYTAENGWLLTHVLRGDWGFDGTVMSDWFGSRSTAPTVNAGLDIEMPGPPRDRGAALVAAVEAGEVGRDTVRKRALNVLGLMERTGALLDQRPHQERADDRPETRELIRRAGAAGMVLLKNDGMLPLSEPRGTIAVIGPNAQVAQIMGGGSAQLNPHYAVSPWDGLVARLGGERLVHEQGCTNHRWEPLWTGDLTVEFFAGRDFGAAPAHVEPMNAATAFWIPPIAGGKVQADSFAARISGAYTPEQSGTHRFGVTAAGYARLYVDGSLVADAWEGWTKGRTFFEEGCDEVVGEAVLEAGRPVEVVVEFTSKRADNLRFSAIRVGVGRPLSDADIARAAEAAARAETALVFVGRSGEWDTEGSDLEGIALPGRQDELVAAVLKANPRTVVVLQTGGPVELPWMVDAPAILQAWYPGQECGNAIADVLFGDAEPGGRLPQTFPRRWSDNPTWSQDPEVYPGSGGKVRYEEGVFIGYRHYDRFGLEPLFPFGHGLGYTSFALSDLDVIERRGGARATVKVINTGKRRGSTVVQLYVGDLEASVPRPMKELKAFAKIALDPGETRELTFDLAPRAFAFFDQGAGCWRIEEGTFELHAGFSATDLRQSAAISTPPDTLPL